MFQYSSTRLIPVPVGNFNFRFQFFEINEQSLEFYANLAPSPSSCDLQVLRLNSLETALQPIPVKVMEICSSLSPFSKQKSPPIHPTKVAAKKNVFL